MVKMLKIEIKNMGTGNHNDAEYVYEVYANYERILKGKISGHNSDDGWAGLVKMIAEKHLKKDNA